MKTGKSRPPRSQPLSTSDESRPESGRARLAGATTTLTHETEKPEARALYILMEARDSLGGPFDVRSDIAKIEGDEGWAPIVSVAYRPIDHAITRLGGPPIEAIYELKNTPGENPSGFRRNRPRNRSRDLSALISRRLPLSNPVNSSGQPRQPY